MRSQSAALFATAIGTILPAVQFSGLINPVSSLEGVGAFIGRIFPTTHFVTVCRGVFSKGLGFGDLGQPLLALTIAVPVLLALSVYRKSVVSGKSVSLRVDLVVRGVFKKKNKTKNN